jgi:hypothetical protein
MTYKVVTKGAPLEVWAMGFHGESGKARAEKLIAEGYWHRYMYAHDRHKTLEVVPETRR